MRTLLFDLDGTLSDPKVGITTCIRHALQSMGIVPPHADALHWCIGPPLRESLATLVGEHRADEALALYRARFGDVGMYENEIYPGMAELIAREAASGRRIFLATSKAHVFAGPILEYFGVRAHFAGIYGSELDGTRVDKCELMRHLVAREGIDARTAVMVGDRRFDVEAARAVGATAVWAGWGYGDAAERDAARPDHVCRTVDDLVSLLAAL